MSGQNETVRQRGRKARTYKNPRTWGDWKASWEARPTRMRSTLALIIPASVAKKLGITRDTWVRVEVRK